MALMRLDKYLADMGIASRKDLKQIIKSGRVSVDGKAVRIPESKLDPETSSVELDGESLNYKKYHYYIIDKPCGIVTATEDNKQKTVLDLVSPEMKRMGLFPVGRLDKDTSGLIIAAKNDKAHLALSAQLADRSLSRTYDAVVYGKILEPGTVNAPIGRSSKDRKKMAVTADGRNAVTHYEPISYVNGFSHIRCKLETGRTHQIRVHMASIGHAVAGDPLYGPKNDKTKLDGQCLHASRLRFVHPVTNEHVEVECELPDYFADFMKRIGLE